MELRGLGKGQAMNMNGCEVPCAPPKISHVQDQLNGLCHEVDVLRKEFETLVQKLIPVIYQVPTPVTNSKEQVDQPLAPFAENIRVQSRRIREVRISISDLIQCVEV